jgi:hypothetical protein
VRTVASVLVGPAASCKQADSLGVGTPTVSATTPRYTGLSSMGISTYSSAQLVAHLVGDYLLQSDWMAAEKRRHVAPALVHAALYGLPFLPLRPSPAALATIVFSHFAIDRWSLARYAARARDHLAPRCAWTPASRPPWESWVLALITDNTLHVLINGWALRRL